MSLNRYAKKRDANELEIVQALEVLGFSVERLDTPVDLLVGKFGVTLLVEVKTKTGKLTKAQKKFINRDWQGGAVIVAQNVDDILRWFDENTT